MFPRSRIPVILSGKQPYWKKVLTIQSANLIGYWRLNETTGATAIDSSIQGNNGAYTGVDLANAPGPDGIPVPLWGAGDYCNIYSAGLWADINGQEGTFAGWAKVSAAGVWTDGTARECFRLTGDVTSNNIIFVRRTTTNNQLVMTYKGGGGAAQSVTYSGSPTAWFHWAITWSLSGNEVKGYINGAQVDTTKVGLGTWNGAGLAGGCCIGASSTGAAEPWSGWLSNCVLWNTPLAQPQILKLATV